MASRKVDSQKSSAPKLDTKQVRDKIAGDLSSLQSAYGKLSVRPARMLDIEVVLKIWQQYFPDEDPTYAWTAFNGHNFPTLREAPVEARKALSITRQRLTWLSGREAWETNLSAYESLQDPFPYFRVSANRIEPSPSPVMQKERAKYLDLAVKNPPSRRMRNPKYTEPGTYKFTDGRNAFTVEIPTGVIGAGEHDIGEFANLMSSARSAIRIKKSSLVETADWMDQNAPEKSAAWNQNWASRVNVLLRSVTPQGLEESDELVLDGLQHLLGMVGSGKSSLLTVLTVHLVRLGYRVTMVASDVASLLREQAVFDALRPIDARLQAVPLVGRSTRLTHLQRLHTTEALKFGPKLSAQHPAYANLSLVCPLDGMRKDVRPITPGNEPCTSLQLIEEIEDSPLVREGKYDCALMPVCPVHASTRALHNSAILLATPASLLASSPQVPLVTERMRYVEFVMRFSDVVLVDEADLMQVQFDDRFAPTETLVGDSDGILDRLASQVSREIYKPGRPLIGSRADLDEWLTDHQQVQATVNRIYKWLREYPELSQWLERTYFYGDRLLDKVGADMKGIGVDTTNFECAHESFVYAPLAQYSGTYAKSAMESSAGDSFLTSEMPRSEAAHAEWATAVQNEIWHGQTNVAVASLIVWMKSQLHVPPSIDDRKLDNTARRLLFSLMVVVLDRSLRNIIRNWPVAAEELDIDRGTGALFYQPDESLVNLVPEAPMGPVFGFQYIDSDNNGRGTLRFFKVSGVGRALLYHLHDAFELSHGVTGPHVLLTSGTSWAPGSWKYHLRIRPSMVLLPKRSDYTSQTYCVFEPLPDPDNPDRALYVSGRRTDDRIRALRSMIVALTENRGLRPSRFDEELALLPELRRRILVIVGSYDEAVTVGELLSSRTGRSDDVLILKRDPSGFGEDHWQTPKGYLLRSMLNQMPTYAARFLVAPLQAVERGHNILIGEEAAIGSVYFLIRPMPVPFDPLTSVQKMNAWAADYVEQLTGLNVTAAGLKLRTEAHHQWSKVMEGKPLRVTTDEAERSALYWTQMVLTWQCIGRLLRGGVPARVHFIDGKWAPARAGLLDRTRTDDEKTSMLLGYRHILRTSINNADPVHREIARALYGSFAEALENLEGLPNSRLHPDQSCDNEIVDEPTDCGAEQGTAKEIEYIDVLEEDF